MKLSKYILLIIVILFCFVEGLAKSGEGHAGDMSRVFPFDNSDVISNKNILEFYNRVNAYLDYNTFPYEKSYGKATGHPPFLKKYEQLKNMTFGNHRIWYHWGFNKDPQKFSPLVRMVEKNIQEGKLSPSSEYFFWKKLKENISERNKVLMSEWAKISGYRGLRVLSKRLREQSNAFVTILISIHLLGDHTTSETLIIIDRKSLYQEIFDAIDNLAGHQEHHNVMAAKSLKNKLTRVKGNPQKFIDVLALNFTPFLYSLKGSDYNYKKRFKKLGYKMK